MPREAVLLGTKLAFVLFAFITAAVIACIIIPCVIISSILIARRVTAIVVVHVFALFAGSDFRAVVIVGSHFFVGVCFIKQRFCVRCLSSRVTVRGPSRRERPCAPAS
jgi:hypothetical protein